MTSSPFSSGMLLEQSIITIAQRIPLPMVAAPRQLDLNDATDYLWRLGKHRDMTVLLPIQVTLLSDPVARMNKRAKTMSRMDHVLGREGHDYRVTPCGLLAFFKENRTEELLLSLSLFINDNRLNLYRGNMGRLVVWG